ncbi:MAG: 50S ribosomal protein L30 [Clostridia bacterium]|nr:50S ribosomal protein L30 [Clostridia bacterium]
MAELETKKTTVKAKSSKTVEKKIRVTLVKSTIGYNKDQARTAKALGLGKLNSSNELPDNDAVRGMIFKIKHLVRVENID